MAKYIDNFSLKDIAPPSILPDEKVRALIKSIDTELLQVSDDISEAFIYSRIDTLPEPVLDLLAWQWHVDFYELAKNIDAKREMVKGSIKWHRHKGTRGAIIQALEMLGIEAKFIAWYEDDPTEYPTAIEPPESDKYQEPYTFAIDAKLNGDFWERVDWSKPAQTIRRAITESKAARSYMSRIYIHFDDKTEQNLQVGADVFAGIFHDININQHTHSKAQNSIYTAASVVQSFHYAIGLKQPKAQSLTQNIFNGGGVVNGAVWRNGNH